MNYQKNLLGEYISAYPGKAEDYKYFLPSLLPDNFLASDLSIYQLLESATHSLGELNAYARFSTDINFFIRMHAVAESTASSKIEGTQTTLDEAFMQPSQLEAERRDDYLEVHNYISALDLAIDELDRLPLSMRLLNMAHAKLLEGARGQNKLPGSIRMSQNWIGGNSIATSSFLPPAHHHLPTLTADLEVFMNRTDTIPILIKAALIHYQFETIHPYLDGNGRIGRLLIILYLKAAGLLDVQVLYISRFFEANRTEYYHQLSTARSSGNIEPWIKFFLTGIDITATESVQKLHTVANMHDSHFAKLAGLRSSSAAANNLLTKMYSQPIVSINSAAELITDNYINTSRLIDKLVKIGLLTEISGNARNRVFAYKEYLDIFR
jgi:Fic family protein